MLTDEVIRAEKVIVPDLHGEDRGKVFLGLRKAVEVVLLTNTRQPRLNRLCTRKIYRYCGSSIHHHICIRFQDFQLLAKAILKVENITVLISPSS